MLSAKKVIAPSDDMGAGHRPELVGMADAYEVGEIANVVLVGAPGPGIGGVGKPFDYGRHFRQVAKLLGGEHAAIRLDQGDRGGLNGLLHNLHFTLDNVFYQE